MTDKPSRAPYLRFGEAERPIMGPAAEIVGNARALLQLREQPSGFLNPLTSGKFKPANFDGIDDPNDTLDDSFDEPAPAQNPAAALKGFDGKNPEGAWQLFVQDGSGSGGGVLSDGYALKIKAKFRP